MTVQDRRMSSYLHHGAGPRTFAGVPIHDWQWREEVNFLICNVCRGWDGAHRKGLAQLLPAGLQGRVALIGGEGGCVLVLCRIFPAHALPRIWLSILVRFNLGTWL